MIFSHIENRQVQNPLYIKDSRYTDETEQICKYAVKMHLKYLETRKPRPSCNGKVVILLDNIYIDTDCRKRPEILRSLQDCKKIHYENKVPDIN